MRITQDLIKIFANWTKLKIRIHASETNKDVYFKEGQVWWASIGQNVGVEANGKNENYERPVIIIKKFNGHSFLGVTLSTVKKAGDYYVELKDVKGVSNIVNLSQVKNMSTKRLLRRITDEDLSVEDFNLIIDKIIEYLEKAKAPQSEAFSEPLTES